MRMTIIDRVDRLIALQDQLRPQRFDFVLAATVASMMGLTLLFMTEPSTPRSPATHARSTSR